MGQQTSPAPRTSGEAIACRFVELIGGLNPDPIAPLLAEDFVFRTMFRSNGLPLHARADRATFLSFLIQAREIFPNKCPHQIVSVISQGGHVVVESECQSLFDDGRRYANVFSFHVIVRDNLIAEVREYTDFLHTFEIIFSGSSDK